MAAFRFSVRHVGYWRGQVHRWSTNYVFFGTPDSPPSAEDCQTMLLWDDQMCYGGNVSESGTYECAVYDLSKKGTHIAIYTRFDWKDPATWINPSGAAWTTTGVQKDQTMEVALVVEWAGGLGATGKPVYFRKWYHNVPISNPTGAGAQISAADLMSLSAHASGVRGLFGANGLLFGSKAGRIAGSPRILNWYGNHQMPKGKKKRKTAAAVRSDSIVGQLLAQLNAENHPYE